MKPIGGFYPKTAADDVVIKAATKVRYNNLIIFDFIIYYN